MKQFKTLLLEINSRSLKSQEKIINEKFLDWKGSNSQTDDIVVIGVKI